MYYILPLEHYESRYTCQQAAWIDHALAGKEIAFIPGVQTSKEIRRGSVLDATGRSHFAMSQISQVLDLIDAQVITPDDHIFFTDFWHPGVQAIPYAMDLIYGGHCRMGAFWHAQSVDEYDFTYSMRDWMRSWERATLNLLACTFVACPTMKKLIVDQFPFVEDKIHSLGLMFSSELVQKQMKPLAKEDRIVFSSRLDPEKQPEFFLDVICYLESQDMGYTYVICRGRHIEHIDPELVKRCVSMQKRLGNRFQLRTGLKKQEYYDEISRAKVQFNCALQDFISFTLLEGVCAGCYPVYPRFRSFPETLDNQDEFMYDPWSVGSAAMAIANAMDDSHFTANARESRMWIARQCDGTVQRMYDQLVHGRHLPWRLDA